MLLIVQVYPTIKLIPIVYIDAGKVDSCHIGERPQESVPRLMSVKPEALFEGRHAHLQDVKGRNLYRRCASSQNSIVSQVLPEMADKPRPPPGCVSEFQRVQDEFRSH